jgi:hypothetical protein
MSNCVLLSRALALTRTLTLALMQWPPLAGNLLDQLIHHSVC